MKYFFILFTSFIFAFSSCNSQTNSISLVSPKDANAYINSNQNIQLIDVRTPEEFAEFHVKNAQNINVESSDFEAAIATLDKSKPVYVYCKKGGRSSKATKIMAAAGFSQIFDIQGGITLWQQEGLQVEK